MCRSILIVLAAFATSAFAQLMVNTPASVLSCLPVQLSWSGGQGPYYVGIIPGGQPNGPILKDFGQQTGTSLSWDVTLPAGSSYTIQIRDSTGTLNYSAQFTIQPSTQTCPSASPAQSASSAHANQTATSTPAKPAAEAVKNATAPIVSVTPAPKTNVSTTVPTHTTATNSTLPTKNVPSANSPFTSPSNTIAAATAASGAARLTSGFAAIAVSVVVICFASHV